MAQPVYSVIVVSWNVAPYLRRCLASLVAEANTVPLEVWVVDNNSADGSADMVRQEFPSVHLMALQENYGFAAANNLAAHAALGNCLVLLNPDIEVRPGFFVELGKFLQQHSWAGIVGGRLENSNGTLQPSVRRFPTLWPALLDSLKLLRHFPFLAPRYLATNFNYDITQQVEQVMGACLAIRRELWERLSGFDEGYWIWFEEADLCYRASHVGAEVWYDAMLQARHAGAQSFSQVAFLQRHRWFTKSLLRYFTNHRTRCEFVLVWLASRPWYVVAYILDHVSSHRVRT